MSNRVGKHRLGRAESGPVAFHNQQRPHKPLKMLTWEAAHAAKFSALPAQEQVGHYNWVGDKSNYNRVFFQ